MAASLLGLDTSTLKLLRRLRDSFTFDVGIRQTGTEVTFNEDENILRIDPAGLDSTYAPYELVRKMRASFYMLGALIGRKGEAKVSLPGGCAWGPRPVDLHQQGLEKMGVEVTLDGGYGLAALPGETVKGGEFTLEPGSVGATGNLVLGAVKRAEKFVLHNAARESDVVFLCKMLTKLGAD